MIDKFNNWITDHFIITALLAMIIVGAAATNLPNIKFDSDYRIFFSEDNPQLQAFDELQGNYTKNDSVMFVIAPNDGKAFSASTLSLVEELTKRAWKLPFSQRVDSVTNYQHTEAEEDDLVVEDLVYKALQKSPEELTKAEKAALNEPSLVKRLIGEDSRVTAVNVTVEIPGANNTKELPAVVKAARDLKAEFAEKYPDVKIYLTGRVVNNYAFKEASLFDLSHIVPLAFLIAMLCVSIYMFMASGSIVTTISGTIATLAVIITSILFAQGIAILAGIHMSPPAANAPTMILTLAIADSIHILVTFFHHMRMGEDKKTAIKESLRINHQPVFLTSITTLIGFLSLNFSDAPPFRDLGNIVAIGVFAAWVFSITLLPALLMMLPIKVKKSPEESVGWISRLAEILIKEYRKVLAISIAIILACGAFLPSNELNDVWSEYFDKSMPQRQAGDFTRANLTGLNNISYSVASSESGGISEPSYLSQLDEMTEWFRQQPEVVHVNTFTDVMKRLNKNMHADDEQWYILPDNRELAAQYLLLYEMSLPFGLDLNNQINVDKSATRLTVTVRNISTNELLSLQSRAHEWIQHNTEGLTIGEGSSSDVMFAHIGYRNVRTMLEGTFLALLLISAMLAVSLRSFRYGMISLLPNLLPALVAFGIWGMFVGRVGLGLSVVAGMTLGIVVDYSVHFLSKFLRAKREKGLSTEDAIRYAFSTVGVALFVTTIILFANFSVLALSDFGLNSQMGLLTAVTIVVALLVDFFFLPPLLLYLAKRKQHSTYSDINVMPKSELKDDSANVIPTSR